jgi:hypothetical protein
MCSCKHVPIKINLSLNFNYAPRHQDSLVGGGSSTHSLTSALDGGEWSASRPCHFTPGEKSPGSYWIGGWVDFRAGEEKHSQPSPGTEPPIPDRSARSTSHYTDWATPVLKYVPTRAVTHLTQRHIIFRLEKASHGQDVVERTVVSADYGSHNESQVRVET